MLRDISFSHTMYFQGYARERGGGERRERGIHLRRNRISFSTTRARWRSHRDSRGLPVVPALTLSVIGDASNHDYGRTKRTNVTFLDVHPNRNNPNDRIFTLERRDRSWTIDEVSQKYSLIWANRDVVIVRLPFDIRHIRKRRQNKICLGIILRIKLHSFYIHFLHSAQTTCVICVLRAITIIRIENFVKLVEQSKSPWMMMQQLEFKPSNIIRRQHEYYIHYRMFLTAPA